MSRSSEQGNFGFEVVKTFISAFIDKKCFLMLYKTYVRVYTLNIASKLGLLTIRQKHQAPRKNSETSNKTSIMQASRTKATCSERLSSLNLYSLEQRRIRGDLIGTYKILTHKEDIKSGTILQYSTHSNQTRGHELKLYKHHSRLDIRKYLFMQPENSLPLEQLVSPCCN